MRLIVGFLHRVLMPSIGSLFLAVVAILVLVMRAEAQADCSVMPQPEDCGDWVSYSWHCQVCPEDCPTCDGFPNPFGHPCGTTLEWSHGALIPHGTYRGHVLMWGHTRGTEATGTMQTEAWLFNPNAGQPNRIIFVASPLVDTSIFCGSMTWLDGDLVVAGGQTSSDPGNCEQQLPPNEAYRFLPGALNVTAYPAPCDPPPAPCPYMECKSPFVEGSPWEQLPALEKGRYYATMIALVREGITSLPPLPDILGSSGLILGGAPRQCEDPMATPPVYDIHGTNQWQMLQPNDVWSQSLYSPSTDDTTPENESMTPEPDPSDPKEAYALKSISVPPDFPEPTLDSYPRAYQLMHTENSRFPIFIANDIDSFVRFQSSPGNLPGASWAIKLRYPSSNPQLAQAELWKGPTSAIGDSKDRNYNTTVLIHEYPGPRNRVLSFCGEQSGTGGSELNGTVQEFEPFPDPENGTWRFKIDLITPRLYGNAVILPTREIVIIGGFDHETGNLLPQPELFDPGDGPTFPGSSRLMASAPNAPGTTAPYPRLYHNFALLLADGTVFNAGGEPLEDPSYADPRFTGSVFRPPYLYYGFRPAIVGTEMDDWPFWDDDPEPCSWMLVGVQRTKCVDGFVLLRPAAVTHNYDADQRYIELDWSYDVACGVPRDQECQGNETETRFRVRPPTEDQGPIGYYMLFVIEKDEATGRRAPSVARFIRMVE